MMALAKDYESVMGRSAEIMKKALGLDYSRFEKEEPLLTMRP